MWRACRIMVLVVGPIWSIVQLARNMSGVSSSSITYGGLDIRAFLVLVNLLVVTTWFALVVEYLRHQRETRRVGDAAACARLSKFRHLALWALGVTTVSSGVGGQFHPTQAHVAIPIGDAMSPVLAGSVLTGILARRREQIHSRTPPDRLSETEMESVSRLLVAADPARVRPLQSLTVVTSADCERVLSAVNRPHRSTTEATTIPWDVKVGVFGYPTVTSSDGGIAEFRKKKALELLVWLVLNKDRTRRSAARTSLWESAISDSTFSTVISDMRRALSGMGGAQAHQQWVPPTYSDVIPLSTSIVSDYELLRHAHARFLGNDEYSIDLTNAIADIRDVPFAGTNYLWADLDGTTTRLVITALDACRDLAKWALENNRRSELDVAVSAALRVMPGCEEFLEIQNLYLSGSYPYRRLSRR